MNKRDHIRINQSKGTKVRHKHTPFSQTKVQPSINTIYTKSEVSGIDRAFTPNPKEQELLIPGEFPLPEEVNIYNSTQLLELLDYSPGLDVQDSIARQTYQLHLLHYLYSNPGEREGETSPKNLIESYLSDSRNKKNRPDINDQIIEFKENTEFSTLYGKKITIDDDLLGYIVFDESNTWGTPNPEVLNSEVYPFTKDLIYNIQLLIRITENIQDLKGSPRGSTKSIDRSSTLQKKQNIAEVKSKQKVSIKSSVKTHIKPKTTISSSIKQQEKVRGPDMLVRLQELRSNELRETPKLPELVSVDERIEKSNSKLTRSRKIRRTLNNKQIENNSKLREKYLDLQKEMDSLVSRNKQNTERISIDRKRDMTVIDGRKIYWDEMDFREWSAAREDQEWIETQMIDERIEKSNSKLTRSRKTRQTLSNKIVKEGA